MSKSVFSGYAPELLSYLQIPGGTPLRCGTPTSSKPGQELKFSIKPSVGGRKGWKIMPANQDNLEEPDPEILQRVIEMIHEMEFSGRAVPELITLKV